MAKDTDVVIIGGGLSGLSTGCYAQMNGYRSHILEHNLELGGVCTAWTRGNYLIDGCIHWLLGAGPDGIFRKVYDELGVTRAVELRTLEALHRYEDPARGHVVELTRDLGRYREDLVRLSPEDAPEIDRLIAAAEQVGELRHQIDPPPELMTLVERIESMWEMRHSVTTLLHFRGSLGQWCDHAIRGVALRDYFSSVIAPEMPAIFLPVLMEQLADGQLSRPVGGSRKFRDAIERRYRELGGQVSVHTTVEEILVEGDRAVGVRLTDGSQLRADTVVSTASAHETLLRLLGGRYLDRAARKRLDEWPTFEPIVLFTAGVAMGLTELPSSLLVRQKEPLLVGDRASDVLYLRIYNDDRAFSPEGHCVVQTLLPTRYDWWASRGEAYAGARQETVTRILERIERRIPGITSAVRMTDVATPLTFWRHTRSWRGAYEGWLPTTETFHTHVSKKVSGLAGLYLAGQWVEPGGGVPPALVSGRQVVQLLCNESRREFRTEVPPSYASDMAPLSFRSPALDPLPSSARLGEASARS